MAEKFRKLKIKAGSICAEHTHIGVRYEDSSSKKGKKEALKVLIKVPNISPTWHNTEYFTKVSWKQNMHWNIDDKPSL